MVIERILELLKELSLQHDKKSINSLLSKISLLASRIRWSTMLKLQRYICEKDWFNVQVLYKVLVEEKYVSLYNQHYLALQKEFMQLYDRLSNIAYNSVELKICQFEALNEVTFHFQFDLIKSTLSKHIDLLQNRPTNTDMEWLYLLRIISILGRSCRNMPRLCCGGDLHACAEIFDLMNNHPGLFAYLSGRDGNDLLTNIKGELLVLCQTLVSSVTLVDLQVAVTKLFECKNINALLRVLEQMPKQDIGIEPLNAYIKHLFYHIDLMVGLVKSRLCKTEEYSNMFLSLLEYMKDDPIFYLTVEHLVISINISFLKLAEKFNSASSQIVLSKEQSYLLDQLVFSVNTDHTATDRNLICWCFVNYIAKLQGNFRFPEKKLRAITTLETPDEQLINERLLANYTYIIFIAKEYGIDERQVEIINPLSRGCWIDGEVHLLIAKCDSFTEADLFRIYSFTYDLIDLLELNVVVYIEQKNPKPIFSIDILNLKKRITESEWKAVMLRKVLLNDYVKCVYFQSVYYDVPIENEYTAFITTDSSAYITSNREAIILLDFIRNNPLFSELRYFRTNKELVTAITKNKFGYIKVVLQQLNKGIKNEILDFLTSLNGPCAKIASKYCERKCLQEADIEEIISLYRRNWGITNPSTIIGIIQFRRTPFFDKQELLTRMLPNMLCQLMRKIGEAFIETKMPSLAALYYQVDLVFNSHLSIAEQWNRLNMIPTKLRKSTSLKMDFKDLLEQYMEYQKQLFSINMIKTLILHHERQAGFDHDQSLLSKHSLIIRCILSDKAKLSRITVPDLRRLHQQLSDNIMQTGYMRRMIVELTPRASMVPLTMGLKDAKFSIYSEWLLKNVEIFIKYFILLGDEAQCDLRLAMKRSELNYFVDKVISSRDKSVFSSPVFSYMESYSVSQKHINKLEGKVISVRGNPVSIQLMRSPNPLTMKRNPKYQQEKDLFIEALENNLEFGHDGTLSTGLVGLHCEWINMLSRLERELSHALQQYDHKLVSARQFCSEKKGTVEVIARFDLYKNSLPKNLLETYHRAKKIFDQEPKLDAGSSVQLKQSAKSTDMLDIELTDTTMLAPLTVLEANKIVFIPADGDCLFASILLSLLLYSIGDNEVFRSCYKQYLGIELTEQDLTPLKQDLVTQYQNITYLQSHRFKYLVALFKKIVGVSCVWGGEKEMQMIADMFNISIVLKSELHSSEIAELDVFSPQYGQKPDATITILKCIASPREAISQDDDAYMRMGKIASIATEQHGQHFRAIIDTRAIPVSTTPGIVPVKKGPRYPKASIAEFPRQETLHDELALKLNKSLPDLESPQFSEWFNRLRAIVNAHKNGLLKKEQLAYYQLFLMDLGQFVANFTQDELIRLGYPRSPLTFIDMDKNDYLRFMDNWSMDILSAAYWGQISHEVVKLHKMDTIWVASNVVLDEIKTFKKQLEVTLAIEFIKNTSNYLDIVQGMSEKILIVVAEKSNFKLIRSRLFEVLAVNNKVNEDDIVKFKKYLEDNDGLPSDDEDDVQDDGLARAIKSFEIAVQQILVVISDKYQDVDALILYGEDFSREMVKDVINRIGYRADPKKINRALLTLYPNMFIDKADTANCFDRYRETNFFLFNKGFLPTFNDVIARTCQFIEEELMQFYLEDISRSIDVFEKDKKKIQGIFGIYANLISSFLCEINVRLSNPAFHTVIANELCSNLQSFIHSASNNKLSVAVRSVQCIAEILLLHYSLPGLKSTFKLEEIPAPLVRYRQNIAMTTYAMQAFNRALQVVVGTMDQDRSISISVTNHNYYEWLDNLDDLQGTRIATNRVNHLDDIISDPDIIFMELHPNDVTSTKQFQLDTEALRSYLSKKSQKVITVVIDVTLNSLEDEELHELCRSVETFLESGQLNLIFVQSLTKFSQLGLDKRSGGLFCIYNNNSVLWQKVNQKAKELAANEPIDFATSQYFCRFLREHNLIKEYIQTINRSVRSIYLQTLKRLNELEVPDSGCFQITFSSDEKACYIALNMFTLFAKLDCGFSTESNSHKIDEIAEDILDDLILPLLIKYRLPVTKRMSIGFPLTTVDVALGSIRLKFGLESQVEIEQYIDVIVYASFVINCFFKQDKFPINISDKKQRDKFLKEKYLQYIAMTPEFAQEPYECTYKNDHGLERILHFEKGKITFRKQLRAQGGFKTFNENNIELILRAKGDRIVLSKYNNAAVRRMIAACFTNLDNFSCDKMIEIEWDNTVVVNFEYLKVNNMGITYGRFITGNTTFFYHLEHFQVRLFSSNEDNAEFVEDKRPLFIKQGHVRMPLELMPLDEREFMLREAAYIPNKNSEVPRQIWKQTYMTYLPSPSIANCITINGYGFLLELDTIILSLDGVTVFKRHIDKDSTCVTFDFWGEKDPNHVRFLNIIAAIAIKELKGCQCIAYDEKYKHIIYDIKFHEIDTVVSDAISKIQSSKNELYALLAENTVESSNDVYHLSDFRCSSYLKWPSGKSAQMYVRNKELIEQGLTCIELLKPKTPTLPRPKMFVETTANELGFVRGGLESTRVGSSAVNVGRERDEMSKDESFSATVGLFAPSARRTDYAGILQSQEDKRFNGIPVSYPVSSKNEDTSVHTIGNHWGIDIFVGKNGGQDQRKFSTWYSSELLPILMQANLPRSPIIKPIFYFAPQAGYGGIRISYEKHVKYFIEYLNLVKNSGIMLSVEPGVGENHFVVTIVTPEGELFYINPTTSRHADARTCFAQLISDNIIKSVAVYESQQPIQHDSGKSIVSCGPICVELVRFLATVENLIGVLRTVSLQNGGASFDLLDILNNSHLKELALADEEAYVAIITQIRESHYELLRKLSLDDVQIFAEQEDIKLGLLDPLIHSTNPSYLTKDADDDMDDNNEGSEAELDNDHKDQKLDELSSSERSDNTSANAAQFG